MSAAYCTWRWCLGYGTATLRLRARCRQLTAPGAGAWATAQLRCAFALGVGSLLHLALVLGLRHSYGALSREVYTVGLIYTTKLIHLSFADTVSIAAKAVAILFFEVPIPVASCAVVPLFCYDGDGTTKGHSETIPSCSTH